MNLVRHIMMLLEHVTVDDIRQLRPAERQRLAELLRYLAEQAEKP